MGAFPIRWDRAARTGLLMARTGQFELFTLFADFGRLWRHGNAQRQAGHLERIDQ